MSTDNQTGENPASSSRDAIANEGEERTPTTPRVKWKSFLGLGRGSQTSDSVDEEDKPHWDRWTMGILNDKETEEVPGTVLLLAQNRNEPLGMRHQPERHSASSLPSPYARSRSRSSSRTPAPQVKRTADGQIVLDPQPDDSLNDPLNWPVWRRDVALFSLGYYCAMGGGMTALLAAAYNNVSAEYGVSTQQVALTTGLYMLGLGLGSVIMSPTAILYGKRPVYVLGATLFIVSGVWCALSPNFASLLVARIFQGFAVSPVECLPSATIAEIFFLHERAYRVGIYTLLLLGGKNLMPLVSAAITQGLGWRWIFWMVAILIAFGLVLVFLFVPETFWDRTPRPRVRRPKFRRSVSDLVIRGRRSHPVTPNEKHHDQQPATLKPRKVAHVGFAEDVGDERRGRAGDRAPPASSSVPGGAHLDVSEKPPAEEKEQKEPGYFDLPVTPAPVANNGTPEIILQPPRNSTDVESGPSAPVSRDTSVGAPPPTLQQVYTNNLRARTPVSYLESLRIWNGRISHDKWHRVMVRPFILFAYPAVLWSALIYALSIGWLIVLSEAVAEVYRNHETYNFSALSAGLVYISPFVGGVLGTAVAGKVSDIVVRFMTRRNGGVYEPEFRLVMGIPIAITTVIGLMGFGWSVQEKDKWIVPTIFFGVLSFGCSLGSTTSITFCVDSYRQYAGEALVTLNFSKNVLHGFIFSLFFVDWLKADGAKDVFISIGGIQLACLLTTIPMYIYGKRMRMWTVRKQMMEKF